MTFLFLYTELAEYFINCCAELAKHGSVHIVRWPVNKEAPFKFSFPENLTVYDKNNYSVNQLTELIAKINPSVIICSGWIDKDYLKIVKPYFKKIPTVLTCDTHWRGTIKQHIATLLSPFYLKNRFSHAWVPGEAQLTYATKLGFEKNNIKKGFYCCDLNKFNSVYNLLREKKKNNFPKRFLYVGRYYEFKGVSDLWKAFTEICDEGNYNWELWCLGTGDIKPIEHPKIKHFGFVQPSELNPIMEQTGVFVLPSRFEPWGVVVQEYAAAGYPLLLCKEVGAREAFLEVDQNGFTFDKENIEEIKISMKKIISLDDKQLWQMCEHSHSLAQKIKPENWVKTLTDIVNDKSKK